MHRAIRSVSGFVLSARAQHTTCLQMCVQMSINWDRVPSSILVCEQGGRIKFVNASFVQKVMNFPSITALSLWDIVRDEDVAKVRSALAAAVQDGGLQAVVFDLLLLQRNGSLPQLHECEAHVQADGDDLVLSIILLSPLDKQRAVDAQVTGTLDYLMHAPTPLQMVSTSGQVLWANEALLGQLECSPREYIGKHMHEFTAAPVSELQGKLLHSSDLLSTKKSGESASVPVDATLLVNRRCKQRSSAR
jgi:hypothetical protein